MNPDNDENFAGSRYSAESGSDDSARRGNRMRILLAAVAVLVVLVGSLGVYFGTRDSNSPAISATTSSETPHDAIPAATTTHGTLSLDPINIDAPIVDATVINGVLTPPGDVKEVGIWLDGAPLESATGTTLIAGHVNLAGQGNGALFDLGTLKPGQEIRTIGASGEATTWRVTAVVSRPKSDGIEDSVLDGPEGPRKLAVVTCGGDLEYDDGIGNYVDNVYLYADVV